MRTVASRFSWNFTSTQVWARLRMFSFSSSRSSLVYRHGLVAAHSTLAVGA